MSPTELSYEELKQEIIDELKKQPTGALATSDGEDVTNRYMLVLSDELTLYCFTDVDFRKCKQISVNPKVSVAIGSLQIDGTAVIKGRPLDEENARFIEIFKEKLPEIYKVHENLSIPREAARVIEITPRRIARYNNGLLDVLNIPKEKAHRFEVFTEYQVPEYYE